MATLPSAWSITIFLWYRKSLRLGANPNPDTGLSIFLAFTFLIFGVDHYFGAMLFQLVFDVMTCFLVADIARRSFSERAARTAFVLAPSVRF